MHHPRPAAQCLCHLYSLWYQFSLKLLVRQRNGSEETWQPIYEALNLPLINEFARYHLFEYLSDWNRIGEYCEMANMSEPTIPIAAEREMARREAAQVERARIEAEQHAAEKRRQNELELIRQRKLTEKPKWGTPEAKRLEIERVRKEIEDRKKKISDVE